MKQELKTRDLKIIEKEILEHIDSVFSSNGIEYYLDGGTLLGAIRHKGFIPWDDDIDIIVRRKDFKRALSLLREADSRYKILSQYDDENYFYMFAKVVDSNTKLKELEELPIKDLGVWVDIFPLDNLPSDAAERKRFQKKIYFYRNIISHALRYIKGDMKTIKDKVFCKISYLYGWKRAKQKIEKMCEKTSLNSTGYVADIIAAPRMDLEIPEEAFSETIFVEFEGKSFPAPKGFDVYLTELYGNYMQLPPVEKRVTHHIFKAYKLK